MYQPETIRPVVAAAVQIVKDHLDNTDRVSQEVLDSFKLLDLTLCAMLYPEDIPLIEPALTMSFDNAEALIYEA